MPIPESLLPDLLRIQQIEVTETEVYRQLAARVKDPENAAVLSRIAEDEARHAEFWAKYTGKRPTPEWGRVKISLLLAKVFGLTFALKLREQAEDRAMKSYELVIDAVPEAAAILAEEQKHEQELLSLLNEERLEYIGSIVLGLNDALVELTGALAGLSFALQDSRLIGFAGFITGVAASLSMAASNYLSVRSEGHADRAVRSAFYTGTAYILTVVLLVLPYLLGVHYFTSLGITILIALLIIAGFNFYLSVAKDLPFRQRFFEMSAISLGVAAFTFFIGWISRSVLGIGG